MKNLRLLCKSQNSLGEGICYDSVAGVYYWVDIPQKLFMSLDSAGNVSRYDLPIMAGFIALAEGGGLIIGGNDRLLLWKDGAIIEERSIGCDADRVRINDGCVHPNGEFILFGTCHLAETAPEGEAYCFRGGEVDSYHSGFTVFNGPAFSPKGDRVYFADSPKQVIYCADIDGFDIGEPQVFAEVSKGYPDGMAIDSEGCLWNAHWDGGMITRYDVDGKIVGEFSVPVRRPTALAFSGGDLRTIVVTSASTDVHMAVEEDKIQDGDLFAFDVDVSGFLVPAYKA